jgi:hypothetical protein
MLAHLLLSQFWLNGLTMSCLAAWFPYTHAVSDVAAQVSNSAAQHCSLQSLVVMHGPSARRKQ